MGSITISLHHISSQYVIKRFFATEYFIIFR